MGRQMSDPNSYLLQEQPPKQLSESNYSIIFFRGPDLPEAYRPMIYSKWLRSLRYGNPAFKIIDSDQYYKNYRLVIEHLLAKPSSIVLLAALSDDHDVVLGFSVHREDVLDYIYVHKDCRKIGIGTKLMPEGITTFKHFTLTAGAIWQNKDPAKQKYKHLKFNPFA